MKVLMLGNSMDRQHDVPPGQRRGSLIARELKAAIGEPVEVVTKGFWPSARIPGLVAQWLDEEQPDLLLITATAYPFAYPSVPLRVAGLLGPLGSPVRRAGVGAANTPWIAHNQVFRGLRRFAQLTIGGAYYLSVEEVIANTSEAVRVAVRHEDVVVVLKGPGGGGRYQPTARAAHAAETKRQRVLDSLERLCAELHVDFIRHDVPDYVRNPDVPLIGDGIHGRTEYHEVAADELIPGLIAAWERHHSSAASRELGAGRAHG
jgi:hypothetical protein